MVGAVSSLTLSSSLRLGVRRMQAELSNAQKEVSSGRVADIGLALGGTAKQSVTLNRDLARVKNIVDTNALASSRLSATQDALSQLSKSGQDYLQALSANRGANVSPEILQTAASNSLAAMTTLLNTSLNGEYIFGGTNTDAKPFTDYSASGSAAKQALDDAFSGYFGFTQNDAQAATLTYSDLDGFLDTLQTQFAGPDWSATWSKSSDGGMETRIGLNETAQTSIGINDAAFRNFALATSVVANLFSSNIGANARAAVTQRGIDLIGQATGGIAVVQARIGLQQGRVSDATDRLQAQADLYDRHIQSLEGIDPYEASTQVSTLLEQIENSYALTKRIQQLSLAQYLG